MATKQRQEAVENTAVAVAPGGAVALPAELAQELAGYAKEAAAKERPKISRISLRSGVMSYAGNDMPDNSIEGIIVGGAYRNVWYEGSFDPDVAANPACYALSDDPEGMIPHENASKPQSADCTSCAKAQWGSGMRDGKPTRGKACKQTRRIILLPSTALASVDDVLTAEMAILDIPVTSVGNYATLVNTVSTLLNVPVWAVVTTVKVKPHKKNQFEVVFTPTRPITDEALLRALMKRRDEALRIALTPYEGTGGENDPEAGKPLPVSKPAKF